MTTATTEALLDKELDAEEAAVEIKTVHHKHWHTMADRVLPGGLGVAEPVATYGKNRVCESDGCTTVLSMYNPDKLCWQCSVPSMMERRKQLAAEAEADE